MEKKKLHVMAEEFITACRSAGRNEFLEEMSLLHRTDQQSFVGLIFGWLNNFVDYRTDERNKASVEFVRELHDLYCEATGREYFKDLFPFI